MPHVYVLNISFQILIILANGDVINSVSSTYEVNNEAMQLDTISNQTPTDGRCWLVIC